MPFELERVPINENTMRLVSGTLADYAEFIDHELTLRKNAEYGDAWQAEGPFLAASRMKDKITRVETIIERYRRIPDSGPPDQRLIRQETSAEGFQDIIEMIQYGKMLMLYWAANHLGLAGTESTAAVQVYQDLHDRLDELRYGNATGGQLEQTQSETSPNDEEVH